MKVVQVPIWFKQKGRTMSEGQKRFFDLSLILLGCPIWIPIFFTLMLIVRFVDGKPIFFRQDRVGKNGQIFSMWKFRTMCNEACGQRPMPTIQGDPRVTSLGRILRKIHLDELPQIVNVIKNEMSFIGPRPYNLFMANSLPDCRLMVLPGITGLAQLSMPKSYFDFEAISAHDICYIWHRSLRNEFLILLITVAKMCGGASF